MGERWHGDPELHSCPTMRGLFVLLSLAAGCQAMSVYSGSDYTESNCYDQKQAIVHLFEWHWDWIADECEKVLGPKGFCGVQVSPPMEHIQGGQWWTRYQPVSYKLESRSGNRDQFISMVNRCRNAGLMVVADMVINHMTGHGQSGQGTGGSGYNGGSLDYPGVPFSNCYLVSLNDLDGGKDYVRQKIADYFNDLVNIGVSGFRVDASKHMWPGDLEAIQGRVNGDPFVFHEVIDNGGEPISTSEYFGVGKVTEFRSCSWVGSCIRNNDFGCLQGFGNGLSDGMHAVFLLTIMTTREAMAVEATS